jgi:hypothetical protein
MSPSRSESSLEGLAEQLLPGLVREVGVTQDDVKRASERLGRVPPALLHDGARIALSKAVQSLNLATDQITECLQALYKQYPSKHGEG